MKIAISGAANCGKTTLAKHLAKELDLPVIEEQFKIILAVKQAKTGVKDLKDAFHNLFYDKKNQEEPHINGFLTDRCPIDLFNFWSVHPALHCLPETYDFFKLCKEQSQHYDYVIFPPWGSVTYHNLETGIPGQTMPRMNPWLNLARHSSTLGLAYTWLPAEKIIQLPSHITDIDERTRWLIDKIT